MSSRRLFDLTPEERRERSELIREHNRERTALRTAAARSGWKGLLAWEVEEGILPQESVDRIEREFWVYAAAERRAARGLPPETDDVTP